MVCNLSSTFYTEICLSLSIVYRFDPLHIVDRDCLPRTTPGRYRSRRVSFLALCALGEELYVVFIACIERLLCGAIELRNTVWLVK
jgi:hypothetical protein